MGIKLKLEFDCDNAAFENNYQFYTEIARILKQASNNIVYFHAYENLNRQFDIPMIDINGNKIGVCKTVKTNKTRVKK